MDDILDGIAMAIVAFRCSNLKPPTAMLLESHEEGMRFLSALRQKGEWMAVVGDPSLGHEMQMADGSVWMEIKVMNVAIRWPANKMAVTDGSWRHT